MYEEVWHGCLLASVIQDIQVLGTRGIVVSFEGVDHCIHSTISYIAADNLAVHPLSGFFKKFSSTLRLCRFCIATKAQVGNSTESSFTLRSCASYDQQADDIETDASLSQTFGLKSRSSLNDVSHFHVMNGLPCDLAHDASSEGFVPGTIVHILQELTSERHFTLDQWN